MMAAIWSVAFLTLLVLAPLAWCAWRDRRQERALALRARIHTALRHAFKGESLLSVQIVPPALWHRGQVRLYAPAGWEWLIETAWPFVIKGLPEDYEVVVRPPAQPAAPFSQASRRAA